MSIHQDRDIWEVWVLLMEVVVVVQEAQEKMVGMEELEHK